ncbi:MAG: CcmD family protein [Bacteroidetes bacterium]|nr:CcmD family protein [Bacteroidota bacterium]
MKKLLLLSTLLTNALISFAQDQAPVEMASELRSSGKIYVVVAVLVIIFAGIVVYLTRLDRKITKLEKEIKK